MTAIKCSEESQRRLPRQVKITGQKRSNTVKHGGGWTNELTGNKSVTDLTPEGEESRTTALSCANVVGEGNLMDDLLRTSEFAKPEKIELGRMCGGYRPVPDERKTWPGRTSNIGTPGKW